MSDTGAALLEASLTFRVQVVALAPSCCLVLPWDFYFIGRRRRKSMKRAVAGAWGKGT